MNDIRNCFLPEIPTDFDNSTLVVEKPHALSFQTSSGRRKFVGIILVVCLAVGASMYLNYISKKAADESIN